MSNFDERFNRTSRRIERTGRIIGVFQFVFMIIWVCVFASIIVGAFLLVTNPELIGEFFGRVLSGFKSAQ